MKYLKKYFFILIIYLILFSPITLSHERIATHPLIFKGSFGISELDKVNSFLHSRVQISPLDEENNRIYSNFRYSGGIYKYKDGIIKWDDDVLINQNDFIIGYDYNIGYGYFGMSLLSKEKILISNKDIKGDNYGWFYTNSDYSINDREVSTNLGLIYIHNFQNELNFGGFLFKKSSEEELNINISKTNFQRKLCIPNFSPPDCEEGWEKTELGISEKIVFKHDFIEYGLLFNYKFNDIKYGIKLIPQSSSKSDYEEFTSREGNGLLFLSGIGFQDNIKTFEFNLKYENFNINSATGKTISYFVLYEQNFRKHSHSFYYSLHNSKKLVDGMDYLNRDKEVQIISYEGGKSLHENDKIIMGGRFSYTTEQNYEFGNSDYDTDYPTSGMIFSFSIFVKGEF